VRKSLLLLALAACAPAAPRPSTSTSTSPSTSTSTSPSTLPDAGDGWIEIVDLMNPPAKQPAPEGDKVITRVLGAHVKDRADCADGGWARVAWIGGAFAGSYTAKGADEKAYLVDAVPCGSAGEVNHFVVMSGDKVLIDGKVPENRFFSVHDLDGDGVNEILLVHEAGSGASAQLYSAEDGQLVKFFDFGEVARGECLTARILYRVKGTSIDFKSDKGRMATCR
jgi:hypothetical protein